MISVFADQKSPRLDFVLDFCFGSKGQGWYEWQVITVKERWGDATGKKINYSSEDVPADLRIEPHGLLTDTVIRPKLKLTADGENIRIDGKKDVFAIVFFLLSRMEEYDDADRDEHDRFKARNHCLVKLGFHKRPVVDEAIMELWEKLDLDYSMIRSRYQCVPSFDIDIAWAVKQRGFWRGLGGLLRSKRKADRLAVLRGTKKDDYDTYDVIHEVATQFDRVICFALLGDWSRFDKNIHWRNPDLGSLLRGLNAVGGMGIHPSYRSHLNRSQVLEEATRLYAILGHEISKSRQHFLRLKFPDTYRILLQCGITRDYSMGFADNIGFRAGTCFPFHWFDLRANERTELLIFPFAYVDSAFKDYLKLTPDQSLEEIRELTRNVRAMGGLLMFIWHNSSINDSGEWRGWKRVLDSTLQMAR